MSLTATPEVAAKIISGHFSSVQLRQFFEPTSIALVGASDNSVWSNLVHSSLETIGFTGEVHYVNPKSQTVHGRSTVPNLAAIGQPVDLVYIMVNTGLVLPIVKEMARTGSKNAVILAGGFAEAGPEGLQAQEQIKELAAQENLAILGPNCLGYVNLSSKVAAFPGMDSRLKPGGIGIASQSGAVGAAMLNHAISQGVGISAMISGGNEAVMAINDSMEYLVDDDSTQVIALFLESIRHPEAFIRIASRARAVGKPVIAIKAGSSDASQRVAQAHTGALTGDDKVTSALFRKLGIIRVDSIEELLTTADLFTKTGRLPGKKVGFLAVSGGMCDMGADIAESCGLTFPELASETEHRLRQILPSLGEIHNPFDTTGAVVNQPELLPRMAGVLETDPGIDTLVLALDYPKPGTPGEDYAKAQMALVRQHLALSRAKVVVCEGTGTDLSQETAQLINSLGLPCVSGGMAAVMKALGRLAVWSTQPGPSEGEELQVEPMAVHGAIGAWDEYKARQFLEAHGVPVVPGKLAQDADEAVEAAELLGYPVVAKVVSKDILHKSDIGGVLLNLTSPAEVRSAYASITAAAHQAVPEARVEGILISPMRGGGIELLAGVVQDPNYGPVLAVGLGGIFVEVFKDASLHVLPASRQDIKEMIDRLSGRALLDGIRGGEPSSIENIVEAVHSIASLALRLGDQLESLEVNPLLVRGDRVEALDAVLTWNQIED